MADLPARPSLDHLRRQARDLLRAARAGDTTAAGRIRAVADALTLASAQLAVARGLCTGFTGAAVLYAGGSAAMASIEMSRPRGSATLAGAERAGGGSGMNCA